jgi:hypothetical protein
VVVLFGFYCGIETLVEEGDVLINGRAGSGALGRIQELKYGSKYFSPASKVLFGGWPVWPKISTLYSIYETP